MLRTVKIENFRGFRSFELQNLGRLNLLVGKNNSGKTSILEAIQFLCSRNNPKPLLNAMKNRGEYFLSDDIKAVRDIRHLFYNREIEPGSQFSVSGESRNSLEELIASIEFDQTQQLDDSSADMSFIEDEAFDENPEDEAFDENLDNFQLLDFTIKWIYPEGQDSWNYLIYSNGGLVERSVSPLKYLSSKKVTDTKTQLVTTSALTSEKMIELFDQIVLTPKEKLVEEALQIIEPQIKRIASVGLGRSRRSESREGFFVRFSDSNQRVPIGSMGDGIWRMLGLALATVTVADGVLLVDEIDTGLHFSTMCDMWRLVWETAKKLNVQVFATTHSSDCWTSLASIASREDAAEDGITIQRIEPDKPSSIAFSEREIVIAAERGIEVR